MKFKLLTVSEVLNLVQHHVKVKPTGSPLNVIVHLRNENLRYDDGSLLLLVALMNNQFANTSLW
jgi:hypothetical protein